MAGHAQKESFDWSWVIFTTMICFFFFNDTATTEIYTLSLHDALPIFQLQYAYRGCDFSTDGRLIISNKKESKHG